MFNDKNYMTEIISYIKKNLKRGYTKESLKWALIHQGYSKYEVEKAVIRADKELAESAPILKTKPVIKYEVEPSNIPKEKGSFFDFLKNLFR